MFAGWVSWLGDCTSGVGVAVLLLLPGQQLLLIRIWRSSYSSYFCLHSLCTHGAWLEQRQLLSRRVSLLLLLLLLLCSQLLEIQQTLCMNFCGLPVSSHGSRLDPRPDGASVLLGGCYCGAVCVSGLGWCCCCCCLY